MRKGSIVHRRKVEQIPHGSESSEKSDNRLLDRVDGDGST
jgi:hypothetical protein